ncbi:hypothetical protein ACFL09_04840 [Planctomycetota bacterium]
MAAVDCPNKEVNLQMCPCQSEDCERKGICCECIRNHASKDQKTSCMRDAERPADTRSLRGIATGKCAQHKTNLEFCPCDYEPCGNRGTCCDCVRNHWGNATYPSVACMRS